MAWVRRHKIWSLFFGVILVLVLVVCIQWLIQPKPGHVLDEAKRAGRTAASFPAAEEDYFHDMDGGVALTADEIKGRNTWIVWTGGNDRFWDLITVNSVGALDLLKILSSYPGLAYSRDNRWNYLGLVNEPCFQKATGPDPKHWGLWLDQRRADCPPDPFENNGKYPGVAIGARGKNIETGSFYGYATGIVGLRLFPNPDFDEKAAKNWDPVRYYSDPKYYLRKDLIKPYRVGMSCAFCHVGPNPLKPPADPENPKWENLSSNVGAQYFWVDRIFDWKADPKNLIFQIFHSAKPGTLDTSLVSTDNINNPRTMNAVYSVGARLDVATRWGKEQLAGGELNNKQFNNYVSSGPLTKYFQAPDIVWTPRVLKDGSDSVGVLGALNRVYLNIGLFSEEWLLHFRPLIGGQKITPIKIADAEKNSVYWQATEAQTPDMALFFLKSATPHRLADAPGGTTYLTHDQAMLTRGKVVFAERCARCHSSKVPTPAAGVDPGGCSGSGYLECFNRYWQWTKTDDFKSKMREIVLKPDFLDQNFLSTDLRIPVTMLQTNACSPLASNAIGDNIWDNFSSQTYKSLPAVGTLTVHNPVTGQERQIDLPGGGRGYTRPASLISLWSTAPFLLNNSVGKFNPSPSVEARMGSFQDSIEKMLWPEKRDKDSLLGDKVPGVIARTTERSYLDVSSGYLPGYSKPLLTLGHWLYPSSVTSDGLHIGPIPAGTPVSLIANLNPLADEPGMWAQLKRDKQLLDILLLAKKDLKGVPDDASDEQIRAALSNLVDPMLQVSKCQDFVINKGHYFGTDLFTEEPGLSDADKRALIEFLKTF